MSGLGEVMSCVPYVNVITIIIVVNTHPPAWPHIIAIGFSRLMCLILRTYIVARGCSTNVYVDNYKSIMVIGIDVHIASYLQH